MSYKCTKTITGVGGGGFEPCFVGGSLEKYTFYSISMIFTPLNSSYTSLFILKQSAIIFFCKRSHNSLK